VGGCHETKLLTVVVSPSFQDIGNELDWFHPDEIVFISFFINTTSDSQIWRGRIINAMKPLLGMTLVYSMDTPFSHFYKAYSLHNQNSGRCGDLAGFTIQVVLQTLACSGWYCPRVWSGVAHSWGQDAGSQGHEKQWLTLAWTVRCLLQCHANLENTSPSQKLGLWHIKLATSSLGPSGGNQSDRGNGSESSGPDTLLNKGIWGNLTSN
jgi:hypothetical protein